MQKPLRLAFLALGTLALTLPALAQDHPEGGGAAPPTEAGEPIKFNDGDELIEIMLPRNWKADKHDEDRGQLGFWTGPVKQGTSAGFLAARMPGSRASLTRYNQQTSNGEPVEDSVRIGDGWSESARIDPDGRYVLWERYVEKNGQVLLARVISHKQAVELVRPFAIEMLDTFKIVGDLEGPQLPKDWTVKKVKPFEMWTDADGADASKAEKILKDLGDVRKILAKALGGDPYDESVPVARMYRIPAAYEKAAEKAVGEAPDHGTFDSNSGAILVKLNSSKIQGFDYSIYQSVANQYVTQYFGGSPPYWVSTGLRMYAANAMQDGGKPAKPAKDRLGRTRGVVATKALRLNQYFGKRNTDFPDSQGTAESLWAWHWFFNHAKQGSKYRKTYRAYLDTLRETGDPAAANEVWADTDFDAMLDALKKWGKSLK